MTDKEIKANTMKCTEPFEIRDIVKQQQEAINRQKAEIEKLNNLISQTNKHRGAVINAVTNIDNVKSEAIKEFAERLKKEFLDLHLKDPVERTVKINTKEVAVYYTEWLLHDVAIQEIDDLVKEMTGGDDIGPGKDVRK